MDKALDQLKASLKAAGYSLTRPRLTVFKAMQQQEPQTMHELNVACPSIDRASIYRTTALFEKLGIIERLQIGWKYKLELSNNFQDHHHHLTCRQCGKLIPLPEDSILENRLSELAKLIDFTPESHQVEIRGLCNTCRTKGA